MIYFDSDYNEGACLEIMQALVENNLVQTAGYGEDEYCQRARKLILTACDLDEEKADVRFFVGGTQVNAAFLSSILRSYQSIIAAASAHINTFENGAIEASGHKINVIPSFQGKIFAQGIRDFYEAYLQSDEKTHITEPKAVFISFPTEDGTLYNRKELSDIAKVCKQYGLYLYLDGARLGYGLAAQENDLDLPFIAKCCDAFYIGGTKQGALFGEALVIVNKTLQKDVVFSMKQRGALLAKGRLLGIQFATLFQDDLYLRLSNHAIEQALIIKKALQERGIPLAIDTCSNQLFPIFTDEQLKTLEKKYAFLFWEKSDKGKSCVRICTSWATLPVNTEKLVKDIKAL